MNEALFRITAAALALMLAIGAAARGDEVRELNWEDLMPAEERAAWLAQDEPPMDNFEMMFEGEQETLPVPGVVAELNGQRVRIPGFVVPLESDEGGKLTEFFLVPYFGACIHVPPPPPNQIVYVTVGKAFDLKSMYEPYWVYGTMSTRGHTSGVGASFYTLAADRIVEYH